MPHRTEPNFFVYRRNYLKSWCRISGSQPLKMLPKKQIEIALEIGGARSGLRSKRL
jgi:hypothetical protein